MPVNVIIVVVIALIILIAVVVLFMDAWGSPQGSLPLESAKNSACQTFVGLRCAVSTESIAIPNFDADRDGTFGLGEEDSGWIFDSLCGQVGSGGDNLASLCDCYFDLHSETACKSLCLCQGGSTGGGGGGFGACDGTDPCSGPGDCPPGCSCSGGFCVS